MQNIQRKTTLLKLAVIVSVILSISFFTDEAKAQGILVDLVGEYLTPEVAIGVAVQGNYAYVAINGLDVAESLLVIDVSDPSTPIQVGSIFSDDIEAVYVLGDYAYLAGDRLEVVDISVPSNPTLLGFEPIGQGLAVFVSGNVAYVPRLTTLFSTFSVVDPANPSFFGTTSLGDRGYDVQVHNGLAYIAADNNIGLFIADVVDPSNPDTVSTFNTPGQAHGVFFVPGDHVFIADGDSGLRIIDVTNTGNLFEVGFLDGAGVVQDVAVEENFAYLANDFLGMRVIYVKDLTNPVESASMIQKANQRT